MDRLAGLMQRPVPAPPAQPLRLRIRAEPKAPGESASASGASGAKAPPPPAVKSRPPAAGVLASAGAAPEAPPKVLAVVSAPQAGFDISAFLGSFIPGATPAAPQPTPTPLAVPKKVKKKRVVVKITKPGAPALAPAVLAPPPPDATPAAAAAPKKIKKKRVVVKITKPGSAATAGVAGAAAAGETPRPTPRPRPRSTQKTAKLATAVALHGELVEHRAAASRNPARRLLASEYYLNNRQGFVSAIAKLFDPIRRQLERSKKEPSCADKIGTFGLLPQQEIVLNYINNYTPYRGLLLYHGLGSGKTCAAVAAAEGMMDHRPVFVMAPASLRKNFVEEIKFCGAPVYSRDQHWRFVEAAPRTAKSKVLAQVSGLEQAYINSKKGAWVIDTRHPPNWESLDDAQRRSLDAQLTQAISDKYTFIHYNGIRQDGFNKLKREAKSKRGVSNPFSGAVVVLEEAHNFVGMIANKLKKKASLSIEMYQLLMAAEDTKLVFLTGTPFVNYPNEMAIMFNMLRGLMRVHTYTLNTKGAFSQKDAETVIRSISSTDAVEYSPTQRKLSVTRDPAGFVKASGRGVQVKLNMQGNVNSADYDRLVKRELSARDVTVLSSDIHEYKALPDDLEEFSKVFLNPTTNELINRDLLSRRIIGLSSYFRSAAESLMPKYDPEEDFHIDRIKMSNTQFKIYETARMEERKHDKKRAVKRKKNKLLGVYADVASTYRIFSRSFCNFVFPPDIGRPMPHQKGDTKEGEWTVVDEDVLDNAEATVRIQNPDGRYSAEDEGALDKQFSREEQKDYARRITQALAQLEADADKYLIPEGLRTWSPKFLAILERLQAAKGSQLVYSQFRTMEGLGILRLVLLANGYTEFKLTRADGSWKLAEPLSTVHPAFVLYSGEEGEEEKEIIRNAFNGEWNKVPADVVAEMKKIAPNNDRGKVLQTIMITAAGAEGVTLHNVRDVHIVEPYWHPARIRQVIGRARRICSHERLPKADRTVEVWLYLMVFSEHQLENEASTELRNSDKSKVDGVSILTTDQALYEMANIKEHVTKQQEEVVQSASVDCTVHSAKTGVPCFAFPEGRPDKLAYTPNIMDEQSDAVTEANTRTITWKAVEVEIDGVRYALRQDTGELYELEDYRRLMRGENVPAARMRMGGPAAAPGPRPTPRPRAGHQGRQGRGAGAGQFQLQPVGVLEGGPGNWGIVPV
jgi:hypothetical protein